MGATNTSVVATPKPNAAPARITRASPSPKPTPKPAAVPQAFKTPSFPATAQKSAPVKAQKPVVEASAGSMASMEVKPDPIADKLNNLAEGDDALKPLLSYSVPKDDLEALKKLYRYVRKDDFSSARTYLKRISDPMAKKLAIWLYYRAGATDTEAKDIAAFRADNPLWPSRHTLAIRAEGALFWREESPKRVLAYFAERKPVSGAGWAALGGALIDLKRVKEGRPHLRKAWGHYKLTPSMQARIKKKYASHLRPEDHKARVDYLLAQHSKKYLSSVKRLQSLVPKK
ncbi:MAG: hypothetical protein P8Y36_14765, partial [Alphaproteobacteria bacterium]